LGVSEDGVSLIPPGDFRKGKSGWYFMNKGKDFLMNQFFPRTTPTIQMVLEPKAGERSPRVRGPGGN
jgi:hypothetical protein